ncbi:MAG TPA: YdbH domain-containing protein [Candidatus Tectomicrobia bacterium]|nr:YdbH domain-containing protein [Candidatus Tectomicrobia bacterium]
MAPFLLTTQLVRLALGQVFPADRLSLGSAVLNPSGTLVLHDLVLHDTGALAQQPLVTAREVVAAFGWGELFSHQIRRIQASDVTVYARPNGPSQLSLLDLFSELSQSGPAAESNRGTLPLWIDTLRVQGTIHVEAIKGLVPASANWPLALQMTMSGDGMAPSRQFRVAIGETRLLAEENPKEPSDAATEPAANADAAFGLLTEVETQPAAVGTRIVLHRLAARRVALTLEADTLGQYMTNLPPELQTRTETSLGNVWASGELDLQGPTNGKQFVGSFGFAGVRVRMPGGSPMMLSVDDLAGSGTIDTPLPPGARTTMTIDRLQAKNIRASIEVDTLRRYATNLPADLRGPFDADLRALNVSGLIGSGMGDAMGFSGQIRLQDLSVRSPTDGKHPFALDRLVAAGSVESQFHPWAPAALKVRDGALQWATLSYRNNALNNLDASWRLDGQKLMIDRLTGEVFDGHISGSLAWDLRTQSMPRCEFQMKNIDMHAALANLAPEHLDMEGNASGFLHMVLSAEGKLSGALELVFDGPGILRIGEIEEVKRMLVGNVGLALATLALQDLKRYPFKEGSLYLESVGDNSELKITFARQPRSEADVTPPHKEIINGQEVWVGSLVVPTIDVTIPITGKSLAEILSIVSGARALKGPVSEPHGK